MRFFSLREKLALLIRVYIVLLIMYYIATLLVRIFECWPISSAWNGGGSCVNFYALFLADSFVALITDATILILPLFLAFSLHLPVAKKIKVAAILGAGGLVTIINIYRMCFEFGSHTDISIYAVLSLYTGMAEATVGLICTCLPAISGLITKKRHERSRSSRRSNEDSTSNLTAVHTTRSTLSDTRTNPHWCEC